MKNINMMDTEEKQALIACISLFLTGTSVGFNFAVGVESLFKSDYTIFDTLDKCSIGLCYASMIADLIIAYKYKNGLFRCLANQWSKSSDRSERYYSKRGVFSMICTGLSLTGSTFAFFNHKFSEKNMKLLHWCGGIIATSLSQSVNLFTLTDVCSFSLDDFFNQNVVETSDEEKRELMSIKHN
jgi:hypothetical protein